MSHYRTYRGPDILRNVIVSGYVTFCKFFRKCWHISFLGEPWLRKAKQWMTCIFDISFLLTNFNKFCDVSSE